MPRDGDFSRGRRAGEPQGVHREEQGRVRERFAAGASTALSAPDPRPGAPAAPPLPRALTFDYWDTIYDGAAVPERAELRVAAVHRLFAALGRSLSDRELLDAYEASGTEAHRWWKEEHRGYTTAERIRWMLGQLGIERPDDCKHVAAACRAVDDALLRHPPALLPGALETIRALAGRFPLAIISDTGFASGQAQDALLERDGLLELFPVRIYSMDIGHAKPRPEPFEAAVRALGVRAGDALHIGDIERTDVRGALGAGLRAARCDVMPRRRGGSSAELVFREYGELGEYLE